MEEFRRKFSSPVPFHLAFALTILSFWAVRSQSLDNLSGQTPVKLSGSIQATSMTMGTVGAQQFSPAFAGVLTGSPVLSIYGLALPFSFSLSNTSTSYQQPFNEFGLSPSYKWATVHLGFRSMTFSPFTLAGHTFLGAGAELNPGILRLGFMYGRLQQAVQATDPLKKIDTVIVVDSLSVPGHPDTVKVPDTMQLGKTSDSAPAFRRTGLGVKLGVGTAAHYVDLLFFRASDDTQSINAKNAAASGVTPSSNVIAGISTHQMIASHITWDLDAAMSALTRDLRADTLPDSVLHLPSIVKSLISPNISSSYAWAVQSGLRLSWPLVSTALLYKRVQPGYTSLGAYFVQNDVEEFSIAPSLRLVKGKLSLSGKFGLQHDNLARNKVQTTQRVVGSVNLSLHPNSIFGFDASYCNYTTGQKSKLDSLYDSSAINQSLHTLTVTPTLMFTGTTWSHLLCLTGQFQELVDYSKATAGNSSLYGLFSYSATHVPLSMTLSPSASWTHSIISAIRTDMLTSGLRVSKGFFNRSLTVSLDNSGGYETSSAAGSYGKIDEVSGMQVSWIVSKRHTFSGRYSISQS